MENKEKVLFYIALQRLEFRGELIKGEGFLMCSTEKIEQEIERIKRETIRRIMERHLKTKENNPSLSFFYDRRNCAIDKNFGYAIIEM